MRDVLRHRDFRLLWIGELISMLGDQFYYIALPWLVLKLTGDPLAMGLVLALSGVPRAIFMLVGGALTDRFSPRALMLYSNLMRMALAALLAALVLTNQVTLPMIYIMACIFGTVDAFFFPAQGSMVPQLVEPEQLQAGNAIIHGTGQLSLMLGPGMAGVLIALLGAEQGGASQAPPETLGIGLAFAIDALTFVASAVTLGMMHTGRARGRQQGEHEPVLRAIGAALASLWQDVPLRTFFLIAAAINLFITGPVTVGIPLLADTRLPEGAAAYGMIMSAFGAGMLAGTLLAGTLPRPAPQRMGALLLVVISALGIGLILLGLVQSTWLAALVTLAMGMADGYVVIMFVTWFQGRVTPGMLGRMMSLFMFASFALQPLSNALAGALAGIDATTMFAIAGALLTATTLLSAFNPRVRAMDAPSANALRAPRISE